MLQTIQEVDISPPIKIGWFHNSDYSIRGIFLDNHNWDKFYYFHKDEIRDVEAKEVEKMINCKGDDAGFFVYYCPKCEECHTVKFGCNSRLCSNCGKRYTDQWAKNLSNRMFKSISHRHVVMTIPEILRTVIREHRQILLKVLMDSAIKALNDTLSYTLRRKVLAGAIIVLHPFGRDLVFNPHIHILLTEGGFEKISRKFISKRYIPFKALRKTWQYQILTNFKKILPKTREYTTLIDRLFKDYPQGFYIHAPKESRIRSKREISKYVARYIRHPAIANSRICYYDGNSVTFWYMDNSGVKHYRTLTVNNFIRAIIQHIPDRQFKMIRYYGAYCRKWKSKYQQSLLLLSSISPQKLEDSISRWSPRCPKCGTRMEFVIYWKKGPPIGEEFGGRIDDWNYLYGS